jgi:hypothetical protein
MFDELGEGDRAVTALEDALVVAPTMAGDPFWHENAARANLLSRAIASASAAGTSIDFELALATENVDRARRLAASVDGSEARQLAELIVAAWSGDLGAVETIHQQAAEQPLDSTLVSWSARLADRGGDRALADRYRTWLTIIEGSSGAAAGIVRTHPESEGSRRAGPPNLTAGSAGQYGLYTYRRMLPGDLMLPGMVQLYVDRMEDSPSH